MNGGIDQLVDTYKGNPQPLQAKVQKAQQGQPPGEIPPDLEEAMALQKIAELRNSMGNQQAMQAGGAQPSVVDKLRQMLAGNQAQAQMAQAPQGGPPQMPQGQPVMAARGGSIDQLMSNLGRHYAGGGIIAFNGTTESKVEDEDKKPLRYYPLSEQGADYVARKQAAREAKAKEEAEAEARRQALVSQIPTGGQEAPASTGPMPSELERRVSNTLAAMPGASVSKAFSGSGIRALMGLLGIAGDREEKSPVAATPPANIRSQLNAADAAQFAEKPTPKLPAAPTANVPPTANVNAPAAPAKPAAETMDPMEKAIRNSIMKTMAQDPDAVRRKAIEDNQRDMGLDALLKPAQDRAAAREARIKEIQGSRQPLWIDALMSAGKPTRGGIAGVLQNMAVGTISGKQNYEAEDLKFLDELNKLNSEIDKARIEGRYKDVAAGKEAVKDLISEKKQSEASGTSLLNKQAQIEATKQTAKDALAGRNQTASIQAQNVALAREERTRQFNEEQLRKLRQNDVDLANKIEAAIAKRTGQIDMQLQGAKLKPEEEAALLARRNAIVKQVRAEYPSAGAGAANIPPPPQGAVREVKKS
jgi:hypothetical protein